MLSSELLVPTLLMVAAVITLFLTSKDSDAIRMKASRRIISIADVTGVDVRLTALGRAGEYEVFRLKQAATALGAAAISLFGFLSLGSNFGTAIAFSFSFGTFSYLYLDRSLTSEVRKNRLLIESEFAPIIEMLTLALSAGETPLAAIDRVSKRSNSRFGLELALVVSQVRLGTPFQDAMDEMGRKLDSVPIRRFVDALVTAMMRGAPLIDVLHRHCAEARQIQRNIVMEKAGKAEISMMIPVVFLILPISVLFALWPSLNHLNLFTA